MLAGVAIPEDKIPLLEELGVTDSKLIAPRKRVVLYHELLKIVDKYHIIEVSPKEIDQCNAVGINLNKLEAMKAAEIVKELSPGKVILDSPEPDAKKFAQYVGKHLPNGHGIELISEHKADVNHKVCGAASILAKVTRDRRIEEIKKIAGIDFGSGYPSDPRCKKFLKEHFKGNISEHIRKCWAPYILEKERREQKNIFDF